MFGDTTDYRAFGPRLEHRF